MSSHTAPTTQTYQVHPFPSLRNITGGNALIYARTAFCVLSTLVLASLALRVVLPLFLVEGGIMPAVNFITAPFVAPFNNVLPSVSSMIQAGAALAYVVYFVLFRLIASSLKTVSDPVKSY